MGCETEFGRQERLWDKPTFMVTMKLTCRSDEKFQFYGVFCQNKVIKLNTRYTAANQYHEYIKCTNQLCSRVVSNTGDRIKQKISVSH